MSRPVKKFSLNLSRENYEKILELKKKPEYRLAADTRLLNYLISKGIEAVTVEKS